MSEEKHATESGGCDNVLRGQRYSTAHKAVGRVGINGEMISRGNPGGEQTLPSTTSSTTILYEIKRKLTSDSTVRNQRPAKELWRNNNNKQNPDFKEMLILWFPVGYI